MVPGAASRAKRPRPAVDGLHPPFTAPGEASRAGRSGHAHGTTGAQRDEMVSARTRIRVVCPQAPAAHVDHRHDAGRVRGVLCFNCNSAVGTLGDDPDTLRRAISPLEGHAWKPTLAAPGVYQLPS
ncbi:endonuclease domain-containing protein [Streptomyces sp. NPDC053755]|uniref:endonuclease domain-containing protein n=1 Tax=Streptomyces sp. NPDC053755 TaxID=3155815 RepID=UPI00343FDA90